jgi:hypothetical protein
MMMEGADNKGDRGGRKGVNGILPDADAVLVEEFISLVAEIAVRSLTKGRLEAENDWDR